MSKAPISSSSAAVSWLAPPLSRLLLEPGQIIILDDLGRGTLPIEALHGLRVTRSGDLRDPAALLEATRGMDAVIFQATLRITACAANPLSALRAWWRIVI